MFITLQYQNHQSSGRPMEFPNLQTSGGQFTRVDGRKPDGERFSQVMKHQCSCFAPIAHFSPQKLLTFHLIYHFDRRVGKWGEGSTESASRFENRAECSNKAEPPWLVPPPERKMPRNEWKSAVHLLFEKCYILYK